MTAIPIACTLTTKDAAGQALEWSDLGRHNTSFDRVEGGASLTFPSQHRTALEDLAAREAQCCDISLADSRRR